VHGVILNASVLSVRREPYIQLICIKIEIGNM
jgi:hypothetical protein